MVEQKENLLTVWVSQDKEVALQSVLMYGGVALERGYWKKFHLMLWGPSIKLAATDAEIQKKLKMLQDTGVEMSACVVCVEEYGCEKELNALGIEIGHVGVLYTEALKSDDWAVVSY